MSLVKHVIGIHSVIRYAGMFQPITDIQDALFLAIRFNIKSEIIGGWLYCFTTPLIGFTFSCISDDNKYNKQRYIGYGIRETKKHFKLFINNTEVSK
jgi:hypothetical protein